ncbi:hypothetical protein Goari_002460 [Gossypium aridum]|uniref:Uncharacterized protein n=1 Tax=Gossypium aridum TaxID=34290 RepID=A0A7J8Y8E3_GOSAI|nr:hypothetical protein [Gossypium aridum]
MYFHLFGSRLVHVRQSVIKRI